MFSEYCSMNTYEIDAPESSDVRSLAIATEDRMVSAQEEMIELETP